MRHYYDDSDSDPDEDELQAIAFNDLYEKESSDMEENKDDLNDFPILDGDSDEKVNDAKEDKTPMALWFLEN